MVMSAWQLSPDEPMERSQNARGKSSVYARPRISGGCGEFSACANRIGRMI